MPGLRYPYNQLAADFVLGDRRLADRKDVRVQFEWEGIIRGHGIGGIFQRLDYSEPRRHFYYVFPIAAKHTDHHASITFTFADDLEERECKLVSLLAAVVACSQFSRGEQLHSILPNEIGRSLRDLRESLGVSGADIARELAVGELAIVRWESGAIPPDRVLYKWFRALGLVCPPKTALVRVGDFSPEILRFLQEDPARLRSLSPDEFERFVANRLDRMGYKVTLTGASNRKDGGIDLIAVPNQDYLGSVVIAGQVKHHAGDQLSGRKDVRDLLEWKGSVFNAGLLVTNTGFTRDAVFAAQKSENSHFLRLKDFTHLKRWLQDQWGTEDDWRGIPDQVELARGIVIEIPRPRITTALLEGGLLIDSTKRPRRGP